MAPTSLGVSIGLGHGEGIDFYVHTVPIRLTHTPTICWVLPIT